MQEPWAKLYSNQQAEKVLHSQTHTIVSRIPLHGMARPQFEDGGNGLQIWRVVANIFVKQ
jgi:hypothetical protein